MVLAVDEFRGGKTIITFRQLNDLSLSTRAIVLVVFLLCSFTSRCHGQSATSFVFASGNTGSLITDQDAQMNLGSFDQANVTAVADRIGCSLTHSVRVEDAVGVYPDSAENSFIVQTNLGKAQTTYLASLLGRYAHQKFVLWFMPRPTGMDRLWIITSPQPWDAVVSSARRMHVTPVTVSKAQTRTVVYIVDFGSKLTGVLNDLTSQLEAVAETSNGSYGMPGNEDRVKAMTEFQRIIQSSEKVNGLHLSSYLWSRRWHDATARTCSTR